jgi:DNA-binding transcriptional ArsR family regulator
VRSNGKVKLNAVKALSHPLRVRCLEVLAARVASPSELAEEFQAPLGNVAYHVRELEGVGLVRIVKESPVRGTVEHFYRADRRRVVALAGHLERLSGELRDLAGAK